MRLARLLDDGSKWIKCMAAAENGFGAANPESVSAFLPSADDNGWLSVYRVDDEAEAELMAAAIRFNQGNIAACHLAVVDSGDLEACGVEVKKVAGNTFHPDANELHYEIGIHCLDDLWKVVSQFLVGEYVRIEQPKVLSSLQTTAKSAKIDLEALTALPKIHGGIASRTLELVKTKHLSLAPQT